MTRSLVEYVLLAVAVGSVLLACVGVLVMRDVYERLQYLAVPGTVGVVALGAAVLVEEGVGQAGLEALLVAALVVVSSAVVTHATARAARLRRSGSPAPAADGRGGPPEGR